MLEDLVDDLVDYFYAVHDWWSARGANRRLAWVLWAIGFYSLAIGRTEISVDIFLASLIIDRLPDKEGRSK